MLAKARPLFGNPETKPLGLLWLFCPYPVVARGLAEILRKEARVLYKREPRKEEGEEAPSVVLFCPNGEDVAREVERLRSLVPDAPVVLILGFGAHDDLALVRSAIRAGAGGFINLGMRSSQIVRALYMTAEGELVVPRELVAGLMRGEDEGEEPPDLSVLTARQREILNLVGEGLTNAQIAKRVFLSEYTVKQHLRAAYKLLGVRNRTEAARLLRVGA